MVLDIVIGVLLLLFVAFGYWKGFMNGVIGFVASAISLVIALFLAKPMANLADSWFNLSKVLGDAIMTSLGRPLNILICGVIAYILVRILFFFLTRMVKRVKEENKAIDVIDKVLGLFLGFAKFSLMICTLFIVITLLQDIPLLGKFLNPEGWFFKDSHLGKFIYEDIFLKLLWPALDPKKDGLLAAFNPTTWK